ncbi:MAG: hypothetical protein K5765_03380 [Clostridia bacterium]|nr:hypothetical protein [Clostridia bacterium]
MKKIVLLMMICFLVLCLFACNDKNAGQTELNTFKQAIEGFNKNSNNYKLNSKLYRDGELYYNVDYCVDNDII